MGQKYDKLSDKQISFIQKQKMFFVGTAYTDGKVNVSPKGLDSLKVVNHKKIIWLNLTGSGNESAAHVLRVARMTLMFASFEGPPMILRVYGKAKVFHNYDKQWQQLYSYFDDYIGARQIFELEIEMVQTSCGMAVPLYEYVQDRDQLINSFKRKGKKGTEKYWKEKNQLSLDGKNTHINKPIS